MKVIKTNANYHVPILALGFTGVIEMNFIGQTVRYYFFNGIEHYRFSTFGRWDFHV